MRRHLRSASSSHTLPDYDASTFRSRPTKHTTTESASLMSDNERLVVKGNALLPVSKISSDKTRRYEPRATEGVGLSKIPSTNKISIAKRYLEMDSLEFELKDKYANKAAIQVYIAQDEYWIWKFQIICSGIEVLIWLIKWRLKRRIQEPSHAVVDLRCLVVASGYPPSCIPGLRSPHLSPYGDVLPVIELLCHAA